MFRLLIGPSIRKEWLESEVAELMQALGEAAVEVRVWEKSAAGRLGASRASKYSAVTQACRLRNCPCRSVCPSRSGVAGKRGLGVAVYGGSNCLSRCVRGEIGGRQACCSTHRVATSQSLGDDQA